MADEPLPEAADNTIGYPTVTAAMEALQKKQSTTTRIQEGWVLIEDFSGGEMTLWSFTPASHPAHPSAVKRSFITRDGATHLQMSVRCEAEKTPCDQLVRDFERLNAEMARAIRDDRS